MWMILALVVAYLIIGGIVISVIDFFEGSNGSMGTLNWFFWPITLVIWLIAIVCKSLFLLAWLISEGCGEGIKRMIQRYKDGEG